MQQFFLMYKKNSTTEKKPQNTNKTNHVFL